MAACTVTLELDHVADPERHMPVLDVGEALVGHVEVVVDAPARCDGLLVEVGLERHDHHGQGGHDDGHRQWHQTVFEARLFEGEWSQGTHRYPFRFEGLPRPTHRGVVSSWDWVVRVTADVPWSADPTDRAPFVVRVPTGQAERGHDAIVYEPLASVRSGGNSFGQSMLKQVQGFITLGVLGVFAAAGLHEALDLEEDARVFLACVFASQLLALWIAKRFHDKQAAGGPELELTMVRPAGGYRAADGQPPVLRGVARLTGKTAFVEALSVDFRIRELTRRPESSGSEATVYHPVEHRHWQTDLRLDATPDDEFTFELPLPEAFSVPFSIPSDDRDRGVTWRVLVCPILQEGEARTTVAEIDVRPAPTAA
jgi:hypothetical protein